VPEACRVSVRAQNQRLQQCGFAAEQMRAAADVEKETMWRIERHQRRKTVAPVRDVAQRFCIGHDIRVKHLQVRTHRPGIGQGLADMQTQTRRCIVERMDHQRIVVLDDDDARIIVFIQLAVEKTLDPIDRQARQPQAEDTPTVH
jgi:hypothetical protein